MTWLKGERIKGTEATAQAAQVASLTAPGWTAYGASGTVLTAVTTPPTLGNTTWIAHYRRSATSDLVRVRLYFLIGSTFSAGSGAYRFLLPFAASANAILGEVGAYWGEDFGTALRAGVAICADSTHLELYLPNGSAAIGSAGTGTAWATSDKIKISFAYEPA